MCGITGVILKEGETFASAGIPEHTVREMKTCTRHRGPDDNGDYLDKHVYLGHNRLSIIDLTKAGHQPMAHKQFLIVFNGEIYNYIEVREELKKLGHAFHTQSDTEVILVAYEAWGPKCLEKLNGMFAFAIYDTTGHTLFIARDRIGIKPLYYTHTKHFFAFASEIKALLRLGIEAKPNDGIIYDYLTKGIYDHSHETFFAGIHRLDAGTYLTIDTTLHAEQHQYWDLVHAKHSAKDWQKELHSLFEDAVMMQLRSDVPVGIHLSGGLDSNTLAVFAREQLRKEGGELRTFTMCFNDERFDERKYVQEVVGVLECQNSFTYFNPDDVPKMISEALYHQDQPFGGVSAMAYLKNAKHVKYDEKVTVVLEGQGGDELFAGYDKYRVAYLKDLYAQKSPLFETELAAYMEKTNKSREAVMHAITATEQEFTHTDETKHVYAECLSPEFTRKFAHRPLHLDAPFSSHLLNAQYQDVKYLKIPRVLRFNDHMTMAAAIELRVPFLDHRIVELAFSMPADLKIKHSMGKQVERELTKGALPDSIRVRHKVSVTTPQTVWLQHELRPFVEEIINSESFASRPYWDVAAVKKRYAEFLADPKPANSFFIWQWIMLELWLSMYIDKEH